MVKKIDLLNPQTGRRYKDDDSVINTAEMIEAIRDALVTNGVPLKGSTQDLRGLAANKPDASSVDPGTTYWSVDTDPNADAVEVSDGTTWTVMV